MGVRHGVVGRVRHRGCRGYGGEARGGRGFEAQGVPGVWG